MFGVQLKNIQILNVKKKKKKNKMKPTNPNADTYVEEQKQYL